MTAEQLSELLLAEHSRANALRVRDWVGQDPDRVALLMQIFLGNNYRLTQRAAWVVGHWGQKFPHLLGPWLELMVAQLSRTDVHDAVKRNVVRVLQDVDLPDDLLGPAADACFQLLDSPQEAVAIRAFAMTVLARICRREPELRSELQAIVQEHAPHTTPAFRGRAKQLKLL